VPRKPSDTTIALFALVISIVSAAFTFFQWWHAEAQAKISVAVEISKSYLKERDVAASGLVVRAVSGGAASISPSDAEAIGRYADQLTYIAFLTNRDRLDKAYLADTITCDIVYTDRAIRVLKRYFTAPDDKELQTFVAANHCNSPIETRSSSK
jgi:hypothetical protein